MTAVPAPKITKTTGTENISNNTPIRKVKNAFDIPANRFPTESKATLSPSVISLFRYPDSSGEANPSMKFRIGNMIAPKVIFTVDTIKVLAKPPIMKEIAVHENVFLLCA